MEGWIKLHRKFLDWGWYQDSNTMRVFLHLLLTANVEDKEFRGFHVYRGQRVIGIKNLSEELNLSIQQTRTALEHLQLTHEITIKSTNKFTIVTICKYDSYQCQNFESNKQNNKQITNEQQTSNKQLTTTKEYKNIRKKEDKNIERVQNEILPQATTPSIDDRREAFRKDVAQYLPQYDSNMLNDFFMYWTESNTNGKKMKFEMQKTWNTSLRLSFWKKREKGFAQKEKRPVGDVANSINVMNKILNR